MDGMQGEQKKETPSDNFQKTIKDFFSKNGPMIGLIIFVLYVILLAIGVTAEVFKIQWILDWWIWSPPGK